jgi:hypothetical protein
LISRQPEEDSSEEDEERQQQQQSASSAPRWGKLEILPGFVEIPNFGVSYFSS